MRRLAVLLLASLPLLLAACADPDPDETTSATPGPITATTASPLHDARRDLASRLRLSPSAVTLTRLQHAGFDGCLGVYRPNQACTSQFIGGLIAYFTANSREYRYHLGGNQFIATDFQPAGTRIDDGMPVPPEIRADLNAVLARYSVHDLALRLSADPASITVTAIVPAGMSSSCKGFERPGQPCTADLVPGAAVFMDTAGKTYRYHVAPSGILATDFEQGTITLTLAPGALDLQLALRQDLARRTSIPLADIAILAFRNVTWPTGCLGVNQPDTFCTQALVPGFLAILAAGQREYRYHGAENGQFIAASFVANATLDEPIPGEP